MRKVLTIAVAALMVVAVMGAANAALSETAWRLQLQCDDGAGGGFGSAGQVGIGTTSVDGVDGQDTVYAYGTDLPGSSRYVAAVIPPVTDTTYLRNIQSTASPYTYPGNIKPYQLRIAAGPNANTSPIRLKVITTSANPSPTVGGLPIFLELKMIDNKGMAGAPTNGTKWMIPFAEASTASNTVIWSMDTALDTNGVAWGNLPMLKLTAGGHTQMIEQGYQMEFRVVPEPSSMLAMGTGLMGLIGFAVRRRRA